MTHQAGSQQPKVFWQKFFGSFFVTAQLGLGRADGCVAAKNIAFIALAVEAAAKFILVAIER